MKTDADVWKAVKPGDMVALSDAKSIIARMKEGKGVSPETYEITSILSAREAKGLASWRFLKLGQTNQWLMAKIVDTAVDLVLLRAAPDWELATREDLVKKELLFMFDAPANPDNFEYDELTYVDTITCTNAEINGNAETAFYRKPQGEMQAQANWNPSQSGVGELLATIVEYAAEANRGLADTNLVLLELGPVPLRGCRSNGGALQMLVGRPISPVDTVVTPR